MSHGIRSAHYFRYIGSGHLYLVNMFPYNVVPILRETWESVSPTNMQSDARYYCHPGRQNSCY